MMNDTDTAIFNVSMKNAITTSYLNCVDLCTTVAEGILDSEDIESLNGKEALLRFIEIVANLNFDVQSM